MVSTETPASAATAAMVVAAYPPSRNCRWAASRMASRLRRAWAWRPVESYRRLGLTFAIDSFNAPVSVTVKCSRLRRGHHGPRRPGAGGGGRAGGGGGQRPRPRGDGGLLRRRLRQRVAGPSPAGLPGARPGAPELEPDLRRRAKSPSAAAADGGGRRHGVDRVGHLRHPGRRGRVPDAGRVDFRRRRRPPGLGAVLPGAGRRDQRRRQRPHHSNGGHHRHHPGRGGEVMILVTGATGHVGSELVRLLAEQGAPARALVHSPDKAAPIQRLGLETALGDYEQPDTLDVAMKGCDQLFLLSPPPPRQPQQEQHVIDAARRAGVGHVVKQSVPWASADAPVVFSRWHGQIEQHLAQSGLAYTLLRPSSFMQNFLMSAPQVADQGALYGMFGEGRVAFIDARDIAAVAAELLTSPGHQGASYTLTGPEALSAAEVAERLAAAPRPPGRARGLRA